MYKHKILLANGMYMTWTDDTKDFYPNYDNGFHHYEIINNTKTVIVPVSAVLMMETIKQGEK